ncbi:MAG TPA: ABC transporter substrate-binding protein [Candidatus Competibacteraceae bacterium]|nr:ABC transporter substrate-binding protein [Candidatus Competibacteraceae bacterium]
MKKLLTVFLFLLLPLLGAQAAPVAPMEVVKTTSERMLEALRQNREALQKDPGKIYPLVEKIVLPHFDFETMSRWVLGKHWRSATPEQRTRFVAEFRNLLVRTYAKALLEYSDEEVRIPAQPGPAADAKEASVRTEIVPNSGKAIPIQYSMLLKDGDWKVFDVVIDGVSIVTNYRSSIAEQVSKEGMEATIARLSQRNSSGS